MLQSRFEWNYLYYHVQFDSPQLQETATEEAVPVRGARRRLRWSHPAGVPRALHRRVRPNLAGKLDQTLARHAAGSGPPCPRW